MNDNKQPDKSLSGDGIELSKRRKLLNLQMQMASKEAKVAWDKLNSQYLTIEKELLNNAHIRETKKDLSEDCNNASLSSADEGATCIRKSISRQICNELPKLKRLLKKRG